MQLRPGSYALTFPAPLSSSSYAIFGGDAVFVRIFCNLIPKSVRISNFFGNKMDQIPQLICSLPFAFPVWKKHPQCGIIKAKKFVQSGDTHVNNPRLKSRACSGKSVL